MNTIEGATLLGSTGRFEDLKSEVLQLVLQDGWKHRSEPFRLSSGELSHDYIDGKRAVAKGSNLIKVAQAIFGLAGAEGVEFDSVGGLTMGADPIAHAMAVIYEKTWFSVRKERKDHGQQRKIEGAEIGPGTNILLVDDVVTTGESMIQGVSAVRDEGAVVVLAVCLVDRGEQAKIQMRKHNVRYRPLLTYKELGIVPVGVSAVSA